MIQFIKNLFSQNTSKSDDVLSNISESAYTDVSHHTGFYRFRKTGRFKIEGIPCIAQQGTDDFIFFTETNLVINPNVIPIKLHSH
jgi:hypothetical protein